MLGVEEAALAVRFTSTLHGLEADPHVLAPTHICAGLASSQAYLLFCACAVTLPDSKVKASNGAEKLSTEFRPIFIMPRNSTLKAYCRKTK